MGSPAFDADAEADGDVGFGELLLDASLGGDGGFDRGAGDGGTPP